ncbi:hypothetical protein Q7C18_06615 [Nesterenkonia sp. CL21]|uniref:hypothetical protein n=1 Tax=Nesterenkonia sp. CL21 TaxID=3064894 RepID=UPI00287A6315|nr:hypothetical protein [Nesterenkonia sp. CL21]MDS2172362.1 hypothetical protein [Nesterenkonia sp. CL21]
MSARPAEDAPSGATMPPNDGVAASAVPPAAPAFDGGGDDPDFFIPARAAQALPLICRIPGVGPRLPQCR